MYLRTQHSEMVLMRNDWRYSEADVKWHGRRNIMQTVVVPLHTQTKTRLVESMDDRGNEIRRAQMREDKLNYDLESLLKSIEEYERLTSQVEERTRAVRKEISNHKKEKKERGMTAAFEKNTNGETNKSIQQGIVKIKKGIDESLEQIETIKRDVYEQQVKRNQLLKALSSYRAKQQEKQALLNKEKPPDNVTIRKAKSPPKTTRQGGLTVDKRLSKKKLLSPTFLDYHS
jgi:hypothetical protein